MRQMSFSEDFGTEKFERKMSSPEGSSGHSVNPEFISVSSNKQLHDMDREQEAGDRIGEQLQLYLHELNDKIDQVNFTCSGIVEKVDKLGEEKSKVWIDPETISKSLNKIQETVEALQTAGTLSESSIANSGLADTLSSLKIDIAGVVAKLNELASLFSTVSYGASPSSESKRQNNIETQVADNAAQIVLHNQNTESPSKIIAQQNVAEHAGAHILNLTQLIFSISSEMANSVADLAKFHPNFAELRKEIITYAIDSKCLIVRYLRGNVGRAQEFYKLKASKEDNSGNLEQFSLISQKEFQSLCEL